MVRGTVKWIPACAGMTGKTGMTGTVGMTEKTGVTEKAEMTEGVKISDVQLTQRERASIVTESSAIDLPTAGYLFLSGLFSTGDSISSIVFHV